VANLLADSICYFLPMSLNSKADKIVMRQNIRTRRNQPFLISPVL
jgi:hypothetical protein